MKKTHPHIHQIPVFPLPLVLFPDEKLPLQIFEPRYLQMMSDILAGDATFGLVYWNNDQRELASVGCLAHVIETHTLMDGRMHILVVGGSRFSTLGFVEGKPYNEAYIEHIKEPHVDSECSQISLELKSKLKHLARLSTKLAGQSADFSEELRMNACELSNWIAANLLSSTEEKQQLLEMNSLQRRLTYENERLDQVVKTLAARSAIEDAFKKS